MHPNAVHVQLTDFVSPVMGSAVWVIAPHAEQFIAVQQGSKNGLQSQAHAPNSSSTE